MFASGVGLCLGQPQLRGERRFEWPRRGTEDQGCAAREETVVQVDDFAGRVKAKHVELAPRTTLSSLAERLNAGRLPDGEVVANLESEIRKLYEAGGRRFPVALLPTEIPASREPGLRLNPQLRRIPAEMRAELTSAEIGMSGSYFDDLLRPRERTAL